MMISRTLTTFGLSSALAFACAAPHAQAIDLPPEFQAIAMTPELNEPVAIAFAPDGRLFVAERAGVVRVVQNGVIISTFIDLRDEINVTFEDRGLLGLALDPNFLVNRRVYLYYTVDPIFGKPNEPGSQATFSRLTRYEGTQASNGNVANLASRTVLIGDTVQTGIPVCSEFHVSGALRFGADGSLLLAHGDGARADGMDAGGLTDSCFAAGMFGSDQDIGAFRAQMLDSMNGKILRINPENGQGLPTNPYFQAGAPTSPRSRVWVSGLRNPYRFCVRPGTGSASHPGALYIGDVGWDAFEEVSVALTGGENFGWPCREGFSTTPMYPFVNLPDWDCESIGTPSNPGPLTTPLLDYHHFTSSQSHPPGPTGFCVTAGVFHVGNGYPSPYRGGFFFADNTLGWIRVARVNAGHQLLSIHSLATAAEGPVDFAIDPLTGDVCYVSLFAGVVYRLHSLIGPGDANHDGTVDVNDLIAVLLGWGPCADPVTCPEDLNVSGQVDVDDLIEVVLNWG